MVRVSHSSSNDTARIGLDMSQCIPLYHVHTPDILRTPFPANLCNHILVPSLIASRRDPPVLLVEIVLIFPTAATKTIVELVTILIFGAVLRMVVGPEA